MVPYVAKLYRTYVGTGGCSFWKKRFLPKTAHPGSQKYTSYVWYHWYVHTISRILDSLGNFEAQK